MNNKMKLKEISELADVSISTVSRVLANSPNVKSATREKVLRVLHESSRAYQKKQTNLIGVVIPDILNPFFPLLLKGMESIASLSNYRLIVCNSENNPLTESKIIDDLMNMNIDGIFFIGCSEKTPDNLSQIAQTRLVPLVFLDRDPGVDSAGLVVVDNIQGMFQSALYLIGLGHRNILYLGGPKKLSTEIERLQGFMQAWNQLDYEKKQLTTLQSDFSFDDAYSQVKQLLATRMPTFTAICASNDLMAQGAYKAVKEAGFNIPTDISIIGYDDIPCSSVLDLTSIRQPFEEMGRMSMLCMLDLLRTPLSAKKLFKLQASLIIRSSCATASRTSYFQ